MLTDYATWHGAMDRPEGSGEARASVRRSLTAHLHRAERTGNTARAAKIRARLTPPYLPPALDYLWDWFAELVRGIAPSGMGGVRIAWQDVHAWSACCAVELAPWESRALLAMGDAYFAAAIPKESGA